MKLFRLLVLRNEQHNEDSNFLLEYYILKLNFELIWKHSIYRD